MWSRVQPTKGLISMVLWQVQIFHESQAWSGLQITPHSCETSMFYFGDHIIHVILIVLIITPKSCKAFIFISELV